MQSKLEGQVAIITGAAQGIGKACAFKLAENGATVVIADICDELGIQSEKEVRKVGKCEYQHLDITNLDQTEKLIQDIYVRLKKIDILVNNAGTNVGGDAKDRTEIDSFTTENWKKLIDINLNGSFYCSRAVSRRMIKQKSGRIVNIGSVFGNVGARKQIGFIASKGAMHNMTRAMALELAPYGINVNCVAPGSVPVKGSLFTGKNAPMGSFEQKMLSHIPLGRFGSVEDIANAVLFLCSDSSSYINGQILTVDGGWTCGYNF